MFLFSHFSLVIQKVFMKAFMKPVKPSQNLFEKPQRGMKIKIYIKFYHWFGIETVNDNGTLTVSRDFL